MEYTIVFKLWESWLFLFGVSLLGILIGYYICRTTFYKSFVQSYTRSKGKSEISLTDIEVSYIKNLIKDNDTLFIIGGTKLEREGMLDYVISHITPTNIIIDMFKEDIYNIEHLPTGIARIITAGSSVDMLNAWSNANNGKILNNVINIYEKGGKSHAILYVYHKDTREYSNVIQCIKLNSQEESKDE